jgi:hypothetical protein
MKGLYMGLHISNPVRSILKHKINDYLFQYRITFLDIQRDYLCDFLVDLNGMIEIDEFLLKPEDEGTSYNNLQHRIIYNDICQIHSMIYADAILRVDKAMRLMLDRGVIGKFKDNLTKKVTSISQLRRVI